MGRVDPRCYLPSQHCERDRTAGGGEAGDARWDRGTSSENGNTNTNVRTGTQPVPLSSTTNPSHTTYHTTLKTISLSLSFGSIEPFFLSQMRSLLLLAIVLFVIVLGSDAKTVRRGDIDVEIDSSDELVRQLDAVVSSMSESGVSAAASAAGAAAAPNAITKKDDKPANHKASADVPKTDANVEKIKAVSATLPKLEDTTQTLGVQKKNYKTKEFEGAKLVYKSKENTLSYYESQGDKLRGIIDINNSPRMRVVSSDTVYLKGTDEPAPGIVISNFYALSTDAAKPDAKKQLRDLYLRFTDSTEGKAKDARDKWFSLVNNAIKIAQAANPQKVDAAKLATESHKCHDLTWDKLFTFTQEEQHIFYNFLASSAGSQNQYKAYLAMKNYKVPESKLFRYDFLAEDIYTRFIALNGSESLHLSSSPALTKFEAAWAKKEFTPALFDGLYDLVRENLQGEFAKFKRSDQCTDMIHTVDKRKASEKEREKGLKEAAKQIGGAAAAGANAVKPSTRFAARRMGSVLQPDAPQPSLLDTQADATLKSVGLVLNRRTSTWGTRQLSWDDKTKLLTISEITRSGPRLEFIVDVGAATKAFQVNGIVPTNGRAGNGMPLLELASYQKRARALSAPVLIEDVLSIRFQKAEEMEALEKAIKAAIPSSARFAQRRIDTDADISTQVESTLSMESEMESNQPAVTKKPDGSRESFASFSKSYDTAAKALAAFNIASQNLKNVNSWGDYSFMTSFQLTDNNGKPLSRAAAKNDFIKIDLPGMMGWSDWVHIDNVIVKPGKQIDIVVRPCFDPSSTEKRDKVSHFFTKEATNTFTIKLQGKKVTAIVHGLKEFANTGAQATSLAAQGRNAAVAYPAWGMQATMPAGLGNISVPGAQSVQWKTFTSKIITS